MRLMFSASGLGAFVWIFFKAYGILTIVFSSGSLMKKSRITLTQLLVNSELTNVHKWKWKVHSVSDNYFVFNNYIVRIGHFLTLWTFTNLISSQWCDALSNTPGIRTLLVILLVTTLPSAHVQRALPVYISAILFLTVKNFCWIYIVDIVGNILCSI